MLQLLCRGAYGRTSSRRYQTLYRSIFGCCTGYHQITGVNACQGMMCCIAINCGSLASKFKAIGGHRVHSIAWFHLLEFPAKLSSLIIIINVCGVASQ